MTQFSILARLPVTKTAASSSDNCNPEPVMRKSAQRHVVCCDRHDVAGPLPRISAPCSPMSVERFVNDDRAGVNARFDANRLVRRGGIDAFLQRCSCGSLAKCREIWGAHACARFGNSTQQSFRRVPNPQLEHALPKIALMRLLSRKPAGEHDQQHRKAEQISAEPAGNWIRGNSRFASCR